MPSCLDSCYVVYIINFHVSIDSPKKERILLGKQDSRVVSYGTLLMPISMRIGPTV